MKKMVVNTIIVLCLSTLVHADCSTIPADINLLKSIESKDVSKAKGLLKQYKADIKNYLANCSQSKEKFEETSVMIHTYEARLADLEFDMNAVGHTTDCTKVPSSRSLEVAFKSKDAQKIKAAYRSYKKDAQSYIEHCASHAEYETVYESAMFCDEMYDEWKQKS